MCFAKSGWGLGLKNPEKPKGSPSIVVTHLFQGRPVPNTCFLTHLVLNSIDSSVFGFGCRFSAGERRLGGHMAQFQPALTGFLVSGDLEARGRAPMDPDSVTPGRLFLADQQGLVLRMPVPIAELAAFGMTAWSLFAPGRCSELGQRRRRPRGSSNPSQPRLAPWRCRCSAGGGDMLRPLCDHALRFDVSSQTAFDRGHLPRLLFY